MSFENTKTHYPTARRVRAASMAAAEEREHLPTWSQCQRHMCDKCHRGAGRGTSYWYLLNPVHVTQAALHPALSRCCEAHLCRCHKCKYGRW